MNVGFGNERITPHLLGSLRLHTVPLGDEGLTEGVDRRRLEQADIVMDASPVEGRVFVPVADAHHLPQGPMLLGEVLQLVVIVIAPQPHGREHQHLPVVEALASAIGSRVLIDIPGDQAQQMIAHLGAGIDMLQCLENGNVLVPTLQIELHVTNPPAIQPPLLRKRLSHPFVLEDDLMSTPTTSSIKRS